MKLSTLGAADAEFLLSAFTPVLGGQAAAEHLVSCLERCHRNDGGPCAEAAGEGRAALAALRSLWCKGAPDSRSGVLPAGLP